MLRGTKVLIVCMVLALFIYLINVIMLDDFLYHMTNKMGMGEGSDFDSRSLVTMFAQACTFMPILAIILGIGYFIFDRVFGQESQDWIQ